MKTRQREREREYLSLTNDSPKITMNIRHSYSQKSPIADAQRESN